jgi:hypothetical protein
VKQLRAFARAALPTGARVDQLFASLRERGVVEGLQSFVYFAALATSRFDRYSHILPAHLIGTTCSQYATATVPGCSANFAGGGAKAKAKARDRRARHHRRQKDHGAAPPAQPGAGGGAGGNPNPAPQGPQIQVPGLPPVELPPLPKNPLGGKGLLDYLLG